jgi:hypothetical protein
MGGFGEGGFAERLAPPSVSIQGPMQATDDFPTDQIGARLTARIGFGVNGEGEGRVCRDCAVFRHRFGSDERHRAMAISSNPLRSTSSWREPPWVPGTHNPSTI